MTDRFISLAECVEFVVDNRGKTAPTADSGIPLIATNCIDSTDLYPSYKNVRYVSQETYDNWFRAHPKPNDIIITLKGSKNGAVCLVPDPVDFAIAQDMVALRANSEIIDPLYLFTVLRSREVQHQIKTLDVSGVIPHLKKTDFNKLTFPYPERRVQEYIGRTYYCFCQKIELLRQQNHTLESIAQTLFKEWFVNFNYPNATGEMQECEFGEIPKGWRVATIDEATSLIIDHRGKTPTKLGGEWATEGYPALSAKNVKAGKIVNADSIKFIGEDLYKKWMKNGLELGDILMTSEAPMGELYFLASDKKYCLSQRLYALRANRSLVTPSYLYYWLQSRVAQSEMEGRSSGSTVVGIRQVELRKVSVLIPDEKTLLSFDDVVFPLLQKMENNYVQMKVLSKNRDILLPKLLNGSIRVEGFGE